MKPDVVVIGLPELYRSIGWEVKVVNPADVPRNNKQDWQKTDKIDSRNLCKHLSDRIISKEFLFLVKNRNICEVYSEDVFILHEAYELLKIISKASCCIIGIKLPRTI